MQTSLTYRTNRDLFSNYYLNEYLPETEAWDEISDEDLQSAYDEIKRLWDREKSTAPQRNEAQLEARFIRPMFRKLGIPFEVEESAKGTQRRPDYAFFETEDAARSAFERRKKGGDFYRNSTAVADAKRWGRALDTRGSGEHRRDFENPSYQIHVYLQETPTRWAVLTNGKQWRLYYGPTSHRLDSYYEVDLPTILEQGDMEAFKYFYLFFRQEAFVEDATGDCFLDDVYDESNVFAEELGEDLQENIYEAIKILSEGFLQYPENDLDEDDLDLIHDSSLIYLYRVIFVLYAEAEGRDLLDTDNEVYEQSYSLNSLKQEVAEELDSGNPKYLGWRDNLWSRLDELFNLIDNGSKSRDIPEEDLYIPAYNGGLFRTDPGEDGSDEAQFLATHRVGDAYLARVIELLTRSEQSDSGEKIFVDYSSLGVRNLGSVYEGLLEYQLNVADEPLALDDDGAYVSADEGGETVVEESEVYLTTDSGERKATGSYYTPEYVVEYIVENTLGPLVEDIRMDLAGQSGFSEGGFAAEFADRVFELKILDPAMGSGHFLTSAVDYLAREIIDAQEKQANQQGVETVNQDHDINWARRQVVQRCIYGVDVNPLAVELSKVSLWLRTLAAEQPLAFLDHHLKTGNSLVGSDIETVLDTGDPDDGTEEGQLTLQDSFDRTRRQALEHVTDQFEDLLAIDNETLSDIKEMETVYEAARDDPLYQQLISMANVHTAEQFGLDVPGDAYERMAEALRDDSWGSIEKQDWYKSAQAMADEQQFFHWELEFPIAFYEQDGERKEDGGFDAVIGNPPWVATAGRADVSANIDTGLRSYLEDAFDGTENQFDLYVAFYEQSIRQSRGGHVGIIVPDAILTREQNAPIREYVLTSTSLSEIVRVGTAFEGVETGAVILISSGKHGAVRCADASSTTTLESIEYTEIPVHTFDEQDAKRFLIYLDEVTRSVLSKIESHSELGTYIDISRGEEISKKADILQPSPQSGLEPIAPGSAVIRYGINRDELRYISEDNIQKRREQYRSPKLIFRQTSDSLIGTYDDEDLITIKSAYNLRSSSDSVDQLRHFLGVLNSSTLNFYHHYKHAAYRSVFPQINQSTFEALPVALNNGPSDEIIEVIDELIDVTSQRQALNLNLLDYLGIPGDELSASKAGETLEEMQMPVAGVADTPLVETTAAYDGLRIEGVSFGEDGGRVVLSVDISYKIEEDDPRETDRWDRLAESEFETYEAMAFVGLSEAQQTLLREFVPVAVEEAGGFAGFRQGAGKTISPLDRLKSLTLPDIDAVGAGLEQYVEVRERADELERKIEKTDALIDEIVYDLYGLTDEEIEIVEEAVGE